MAAPQNQMPATPNVKWAQTAANIYLTVLLANVTELDIKITNKNLVFMGTSSHTRYCCELDFYDDIVEEGSTWNILESSVHINLNKKDTTSSFWPRLLLDKSKERNHVFVDWDKYTEEDVFDISDEILNMDAFIREMEIETIAVEEMIANVEYLSIFSNTKIDELDKVFDSLFIDSELIITEDNFDPNNIALRPPKWNEIRTKRLLIKEYIYRLDGATDDIIEKNRESAVLLEDDLMAQEVVTFCRLLNLSALTSKGGIENAAMAVTLDNFDPDSPYLRPPAWNTIRLRRTIAKEMLNQQSSKEPINYEEIINMRPFRVMDEEKIMLDEVFAHGKVVSFGNPIENKKQIEKIINTRNDEQFQIMRDRAQTLADGPYTRGRADTLRERSQDIRKRSNTSAESTMNDEEREFHDILMKRVLVKEQSDREKGVDEETISNNRNQRIIEVSLDQFR